MNIKSLKLHEESQPLSELFEIDGAIRTVIGLSAYVDLESINQLIDFVRDNADARTQPSLRIFIDKSSSRFLSDRRIHDEFLRAARRINTYCNSESGIFLVQLGALFHSKAYLVEGNTTGRILFGSMNLTQKGINGNEELVLFDDINIGGRTKANRLAEWLKDYTEELHEHSDKVEKNIQDRFPSCMRQLLLDGSVYYESKEQNPFRFKLYLPNEIVKQKANIDDLLDANITDSVSIERLITTGLGIKLPEIGNTHESWKKFCIETCYGQWNPSYLKTNIQQTLKKRIEKRKPHFDEIKQILKEKDDEIRTCFLALCTRIQSHLKIIGIEDWRYAENAVAEKAWNIWIERTNEKMENADHYERLVSGISNVPSPDVWSDPLSSKEFEDSFCESLLYYWSKEYAKETSNVVAQAFAYNLELKADDKENIDNMGLKSRIETWFIKNPSLNIIGFE